jgi:hypothetical protein
VIVFAIGAVIAVSALAYWMKLRFRPRAGRRY